MNTMTNAIVRQYVRNILQQRMFYILLILFYILLVYAAITGYSGLAKQNSIQRQYQELIRKSWEDNPDKHPHRMAHFGSFALRIRHPLSMFDFGLDNYAGNAVYLEAHKQNTVNHSEAGFSTGLLRMGELSIAMLLQVMLPLILFFIGFGSIAADRENGTLKIISSQGTGIGRLMAGRAAGLWIISSFFLLPALAITGILMLLSKQYDGNPEIWPRFFLISLFYILFYWVVSAITVIVSAKSNTAKNALVKLLGIWLIMAVILPKIVQVAGSNMYTAPGKLSFETAIEKDILKQGDSHNPDDPFFKRVKDSVYKRYGVSTADSLPVNLGGIVGSVGEKLSAETYIKHYNDLINIYRKQNGLGKWVGYLNPFMMIKHNSMALAGSDFESYIHFQQQAEAYRYSLAQQMNSLQTKYISNVKPREGNHALHIDNVHFRQFPDFKYRFLPMRKVMELEIISAAALLFWLLLPGLLLIYVSKTFKITSA